MPGCYLYVTRFSEDRREWLESRDDSKAATTNARRRAILEEAAGILNAPMYRLNPLAMGETYRALWSAMERKERNDGRRAPWKWSDAARERTLARNAARREALAREALATEAPRIMEARAIMDRATATARAMVPASVPPEHRESFALWIAAGF